MLLKSQGFTPFFDPWYPIWVIVLEKIFKFTCSVTHVFHLFPVILESRVSISAYFLRPSMFRFLFRIIPLKSLKLLSIVLSLLSFLTYANLWKRENLWCITNDLFWMIKGLLFSHFLKNACEFKNIPERVQLDKQLGVAACEISKLASWMKISEDFFLFIFSLISTRISRREHVQQCITRKQKSTIIRAGEKCVV